MSMQVNSEWKNKNLYPPPPNPHHEIFSQEENMNMEGVEFNVLRVFHHDSRVDTLAWSPESRLDRIPTIRYQGFS